MGDAQMQFEDVGTMPARVLFSHSRVGAGAPFEPLGEASLAPSDGAASFRDIGSKPYESPWADKQCFPHSRRLRPLKPC